jgi:hypothetical protein
VDAILHALLATGLDTHIGHQTKKRNLPLWGKQITGVKFLEKNYKFTVKHNTHEDVDKQGLAWQITTTHSLTFRWQQIED